MSGGAARFVLVHGLYTSRTMWRPQHVALRDAGFHVAVPDLPGHGRRLGERFTAEAAFRTIDEAVDGVAALPGEPGPIILVGLSLGGYLSMEYAGRNPDRVHGLIPMACSTRPLALGVGAYRGLTHALGRLPDRGLRFDAAVQRLVGGKPAATAFLAGGYGIGAAIDAIDAVAAFDPLASIARTVAAGVPVWFVNGELDQMRLQERLFLDAAPRSWHTIVPGATHMVNLAAPRTVSRLLVMAGRAASW